MKMRTLVFLLAFLFGPVIVIGLTIVGAMAVMWLWGLLVAFNYWWLVATVILYCVLGICIGAIAISVFDEW